MSKSISDKKIMERAGCVFSNCFAENENDTAISALKAQMNKHGHTLKELEEAARGSLDVLQELEKKVKKLSGQVKTLSEICLDLEGLLGSGRNKRR